MDHPPPRVRISQSDVRAYLARIHAAPTEAELDALAREIWRRYFEEGLGRIEVALRRRRRTLRDSVSGEVTPERDVVNGW